MIYLADSATYRYTWSGAEAEQGTNPIDLTIDAVDAPVNVTCTVTYQPASYKSVEEAIDKIPADLSIYTEESVQALMKAKEDVEEDNNITEQDEVDAMAEAIANLEKNEDESGNTLTGSVSDEDSDGNGAPKAGDDTNPYIWLVVVLLAGAGALVTVSYKKEDKT